MEIIGSRNQEVLLTEVLQGKWCCWYPGGMVLWELEAPQAAERGSRKDSFPSCDHPLASKESREEVMTSGSPAHYPSVLSSSFVPNTMEVLQDHPLPSGHIQHSPSSPPTSNLILFAMLLFQPKSEELFFFSFVFFFFIIFF